ncbi:MAG: glycosyltransferase [Candidatus Cybelea sp.]
MISVSCIMPTANRRRFIPATIEMFLAQDYSNKELVVVDDGSDRVENIVPNHPRIRYIGLERRLPLGAKRNLACEAARGDVIVHWDDDDWHAPWRLRYQVDALERGSFDMCGVDHVLFVDARAGQAWEYVQAPNSLRWVCGATLCYRKSFWSMHRFADIHLGEDSRFVFGARNARIGILEDNRFFVARIHAANSYPKRPRAGRWHPRPLRAVQSVLGCAWETYFGGEGGLPIPAPTAKIGTALVCAASGIGDILRVTPLMSAVNSLGYDVDVCISPDDPTATELLRGAPAIRRLIAHSNAMNSHAMPIPRIGEQEYDLAAFTALAAPLRRHVVAKRVYPFDSSWRSEGDIAGITRVARAIGWDGELPAPFAMKSTRRFGLPRDTIALHPGCKANWPWKKWHGFDELAALFPNVAVIGTPSDLDNRGTYFARPFRWPDHARDFIGKLDLRDTAALLSQCAALISLDSGMMHLGVALRVPTFGVFGITSPQRECIPSPFMTPITKQLVCEPACRGRSWGRRDCEQHLACLKSLTADEVASRVAVWFRQALV